MLLLFCSIVLVLVASYFAANILDCKNIVNNILFFFISAFANVVLTFELLSLFSGITTRNVLFVNGLFALISMLWWFAKKCPVLRFDIKDTFRRLLNSLKLDKTLIYLMLGFLFACIISLVLIAIIPGVDVDSSSYRVVRSLFWIEHGNLNQFPAAEARMLMFPINSEVLYAWFILFLKSDSFLFIFNFCGLWLFLVSVYGILSQITISLRKKLWVLLISASIPFVILRYTGLETGVIIAALVLSCIYLYIEYLKNYKNSLCFMAALALALGIGTKTTVILMMPAIVLWFIWYSIYCEKKYFYKPIIRFSLYFLLSFLLFASYNYVSNFINYGHFISALNVAKGHSNTDGFLSTFSNLYRYIFDFFAFPEFRWSAELSSKILRLREGLLTLINANNGFGKTSAIYTFVHYTVSSASSSFGFFGPLLFIPAYIYTVYKSFCVKNRKTLLLVSLVYIFLVTVFIMSYKLAFMSYNIRFISTFVLLTVPVLAYFYNKRYGFYKVLISFLAIWYMFALSVNVSLYPVKGLLNAFNQGATLDKIREIEECSFFTEDLDINNYKVRDVFCMVNKSIKKFRPENRILYFASAEDSLMPIKRLMFEGYRIDVALAADIDKVNIDDYNIIITCNDSQTSAVIWSFDKELDKYGYNYNKGILCNYLSPDDKFIKNLSEERDLVDKSTCYFNKEFYKNYNLKLLNKTTYRLGSREDGSVERKTFKLYENMNNPVIR